MYQIAPWLKLIYGLTTGLLSSCLGLVLVNIRPIPKKVVTITVCFALVAFLVRSQNLPIGTHWLLLTTLMVIFFIFSYQLTAVQAFITTILGMLVLGLLEALITSTAHLLFVMETTALLQNNFFLILIPFAEIVLAFVFIHICLRKHYFLFDFLHWDLNFAGSPNEKRVKTILILASGLLFILLLQLVLNMNIFTILPHRYFVHLSDQTHKLLVNASMIGAFLFMIVLMQQLSVLLNKESEYMLQSAQLHTLDEIYTATRAEAHDRFNHIQALYGFVQLGNLEETRNYLEALIGEMVVSPQFFETGNPGLSSLLFIKSGLATAHDINLNININIPLDQLAIPDHELNRILGNLINNSFDSVMNLDQPLRQVSISLEEDDKYYLFRISNPGKIDPDIIFRKGFSTKGYQHQGLGLYIVKKLVEKYRGYIQADNLDNLVIFTVHLPKSQSHHRLI